MSPSYKKLRSIDSSRTSARYQKLTAPLGKVHTSLLMHLRTGHCALNKHLHCMKQVESPYCPHCPRHRETVIHFLLHCPAYAIPRRQLQQAVGRDASSMKRLLTTQKHLPPLFHYIDTTRHFEASFPRITELKLPEDQTRPRP